VGARARSGGARARRALQPRHVITLGIATAVLYGALFALCLLAAGVLIPASELQQELGHPVGVGDDLQLAWLVASIATVGGALGSLADSAEAVRDAVYHPRPSDEAAERGRWPEPPHHQIGGWRCESATTIQGHGIIVPAARLVERLGSSWAVASCWLPSPMLPRERPASPAYGHRAWPATPPALALSFRS
jgi:hypothetical protein